MKLTLCFVFFLFGAIASKYTFGENAAFILCGVLGVVGHCLFKADSLKKQSQLAKVDFKFMNYIEEDIFSILFSFVSVFIWLLVFEQISEVQPKIIGYSRLSFVGCGWMGSYIIQYFFSSAEKRIKSIIDEKTSNNA